MHENRTKYPKKKAQMYQLLQDLPKKYNVTALVRMEKVRASQLLPLRKKLLGEVEIVSIIDKIAKKSFEIIHKAIEAGELTDQLMIPPKVVIR